MSELLDRVLAAHKAIGNGHGVSYNKYNGNFMRAMAAGRKPAPKYKNAALWKKYRDPSANYLLSCLGNGGKH